MNVQLKFNTIKIEFSYKRWNGRTEKLEFQRFENLILALQFFGRSGSRLRISRFAVFVAREIMSTMYVQRAKVFCHSPSEFDIHRGLFSAINQQTETITFFKYCSKIQG